jgi:hypothetical protein
MAMISHKTESIYRRHSIVDQAMLENGHVNARRLQEIQPGEPASGSFDQETSGSTG